MLKMQNEDGGVYHKLTTLNFTGTIMPDHATADRYVIGKGTSAALNFAAVMAQASRIWEEYDAELAEDMLEAAEKAWMWAEANASIAFTYPPDLHTGEYCGRELVSNRALSACELLF